MKKLAFILSSAILFACGGSKTEIQTDFSNITFSMDTVVVDPGQEIINLRSGLWLSSLSEDISKLYLWDNQATMLDIIDLEELKLIEKVKFEKEGPNGAGSFVSWLKYVEPDKVVLSSFNNVGLFDLKGNKVKTYKMDDLEGDGLEEGEGFNQRTVVTNEGKVMYGMLWGWMIENESFAKADFENKTLKKIELPGIENLTDYQIMLKSGDRTMIMPAAKTLRKVGNRLIYSSVAFSDLFIIDMDKDSVYQISYEPSLTAKAKKGGYPSELDSEKRFREVMADIHSEVNFEAPIWDEQNRRFYRFSYETIPSEEKEGPLLGSAQSQSISKIFISIFDEKFNLLGESTLKDLEAVPQFPFVKDGKIWHYINVDDELGFVRMAFD
ncbi:MAG: DUF4221 domain-containing protein [Mongoliibacter sp.]|uniref:DUF4221 family protein n=1 Tax=Mongoliibacter sp. TaxID=2022438 RepID=UPI0012F36498|nr:DUF4221 family protein [Mongoliibacter sp.]TVP54790.1 MAG: DUF4221 domain-containing protein [Mongoliibacter sp.]